MQGAIQHLSANDHCSANDLLGAGEQRLPRAEPLADHGRETPFLDCDYRDRRDVEHLSHGSNHCQASSPVWQHRWAL